MGIGRRASKRYRRPLQKGMVFVMEKQKRVAAIHDISGFGKCSLTVALPILSAAGIETAVMPTAVLSTHTGGFTDFTYRDLTEDLRPFTAHWKSLGLHFDAIYSGFLGSFDQIKIVGEFFDQFKTEENIILVDPAMADNGQMYKIFGLEFAKAMAGLCAKADIIIPNITEAAFMLGLAYKEGPYEKSYIESLLLGLSQLGAKNIVLTGVYFDADALGAATYSARANEVHYALNRRIEGYYHGTGDVYASAFLAALLNKKTLGRSAQIAADFTCGAIARTKASGTDIRFGVDFERGVPEFLRELGLV
jgi:pyridoxine kinase